MLQFTPGSVHRATVNFSNPKSAGFDYSANFCMGADYTVMASASFHLDAGQSKPIPFPITMPAPGTYPVYIVVFSGGKNIALYKATEDVVILAPAVEIPKAYIRMEYPGVSEAYSGWIGFSPVGQELNMGLFGARIQVGVLLRNPTQSPLRYTCTMYNYYTTAAYLTLPSVEPVRFPPAPTGLPYSAYALECDMFLPPGGELPPGKTGFVYTNLFYQQMYNYVYIEITCEGYNLGKTLLYSGLYYVPPPPPPPVVYTCSICGATFNSQAELDAHIASAHPPAKQYWYRVTFIDGSVSDIPVPYDPVGHTSLWDIVDRNSVVSWVYLGYY